MNQDNEKQESEPTILLHLLWGESLRVVTVLFVSWIVVMCWCYFGSADFYRANLSAHRLGNIGVDTCACLYEVSTSVLLLALVPLAFMKIAWNVSPKELGVGLGDARRWILMFIAAIPILLLFSWIGSGSTGLRELYPRDPTAGESVSKFAMYAISRFFFYLAWEFHFRGFLQFALRDSLGKEVSILIQAAACSLAHLRGPPDEAFGAFLGGVWWGAHAFSSRSIWGVTLQHWFLGIAVDALICFYIS